jgi:putative drug exporter of the RND superfamily
VFDHLARGVVARRKLILIATVVMFALAGVLGAGVADKLTSGGFDDPESDASKAAVLLEERFGIEDPNIVLLVSAEGSVDDPATAKAGAALTAELAAEEDLEQVYSYWSTQIPSLKSRGGDQALVIGVIEGSDDHVRERIEELSPKYTREGDLDVGVGGFAEIYREMQENIESDLVKAETIAFPITMILLLFVFGSVVAASLPLAIGGMSIIGAFFLLSVIADLTDVSIFALNLTTMLGLGLAIDYSLFVVSRFREELHNGLEPHQAVMRTVQTAGRTVAFSGLTVALSLGALLVFPLAFLRSFAYAGISVVLVAVLGAVVFLPALLAVVGRNVDRFRLFKREPKEVGEGMWHRVALGVMKRPIPIATGVIALLIVLGIPFFGVKWGQADDRALPASASSHQVQQQIRDNFDSNNANALSVITTSAGRVASDEIDAFARELSTIEGVAGVGAVTGTYFAGEQVSPPNETSAIFAGEKGTWLSVVPSVEAFSPEGEQLVHDIRAVDPGFETRVTGPSARLVDTTESLFSRVPAAAVLIAVATFVLLFLMFGGILVPIKALVLNMLSLSATFGAMVWIFQDGHLSSLLNFTPTGTMELTMPILMFCMAFGLSMDYEVFLLSRIKEEHDAGADNTTAVAMGLERTGRIVTAAAVLLSVVFIAFATSGVTFIKMMGVGLTLAVIMDATLVRATLVPAFMRLAGEANWWAPAWMRRVYNRFGISEGEPHSPATPASAQGGN